MKKLLVLISASLISSTSLASNMQIVEQIDGPTKGTRIIKMYDRKAGVMCYVYTPKTVNVQTSKSYGKTEYVFDSNQAGNISCVNVKK